MPPPNNLCFGLELVLDIMTYIYRLASYISLNNKIHTISCNSKGYADNKFQLLAETIIALKNHGDKRKHNQTTPNITKTFRDLLYSHTISFIQDKV